MALTRKQQLLSLKDVPDRDPAAAQKSSSKVVIMEMSLNRLGIEPSGNPTIDLLPSGIAASGLGFNMWPTQMLQGEPGESFGYSVDADGDYLVVGCPTFDWTIQAGHNKFFMPGANLGRMKIFKRGVDSVNQSSTEYAPFGEPIVGPIIENGWGKPYDQYFGMEVKACVPTQSPSLKHTNLSKCYLGAVGVNVIRNNGNTLQDRPELNQNHYHPHFLGATDFAKRGHMGWYERTGVGYYTVYYPSYSQSQGGGAAHGESVPIRVFHGNPKYARNPDGSIAGVAQDGRKAIMINPNVAGGETATTATDIRNSYGNMSWQFSWGMGGGLQRF